MDRSSLDMTLQELIDSGSLSERAVFYSGDENHEASTSSAINDTAADADGCKTTSSLHVQNAVKLSLLIAKEFARCESEEGGTTISINLSSVQLEHIRVGLSNSKPIQIGSGGGSSERCVSRLCVWDSDDEHDDDDDVDERESSERCVSRLWDNNVEEQKDNVDQPSGISSGTWVIQGVSIVHPPVSREMPSNSNISGSASAMRRLGELIYAVFSHEKKVPLPLADNQVNSEAFCGSDSALEATQSKRLNEEPSLFSNLVETRDYPVSVCRLISDMIDTGTDGKAYSPFKSFSEVIDDLTCMSLQPSTFLHDAGSFEMAFGERSYGNKEELSRLLSIATGVRDLRHRSEVVYVTGVAGIGKTLLCRRVGDVLSDCGWIVAETKFEKGTKHRSRQSIASLFDMLLDKIVQMSKSGWNAADVSYSHRAAQAVTDAFDPASLSDLARFLPNIRELIPGIKRKKTVGPELELKSWQLACWLSKLMGAFLTLDRFIMICLEDMHRCDPVMLALMTDIVIHSGQQMRRCLFVGTYRSNEVSIIHPLKAHCNVLKVSSHVNVSEVQLSSLTEGDVVEMLMTEMRLPKRLVAELGAVIYKKTCGHVLFVVQLLASLVRDAIFTYSPQKLRYDFDPDRLDSVKTLENVASLIASNMSSLSTVDLQNLWLISCFGMQSDVATLKRIQDCPVVQSGSMMPSLDRLVKDGILERDGFLVSFSHDTIYQTIKHTTSLEHRQCAQFKIGTFLGSKASLDGAGGDMPTAANSEQLQMSHAGIQTVSPSLLAVDLINKAGPEYIKDPPQRLRFARWNLKAAFESKANSDFQSALLYYKAGIDFLGNDPLWSNDSLQLCQELREGASFASNAIRNTADTTQLAKRRKL